MRKCAACGRVLAKDRRPGAKFCDTRCRMAMFRAKQRQLDIESLAEAALAPAPDRRCAACGRQMPARRRKGARFCSKRCETRFHRQKTKEAPPPPPDAALAPGLAQALLILMSSRGAALPAADEARIRTCTDCETLRKAIQRMAAAAPGTPGHAALAESDAIQESPPQYSPPSLKKAVPSSPPPAAPPELIEAPLAALPAVPVPGELAAGLSLISDQLPLLTALGRFSEQRQGNPAVSLFLDGIQMIGRQLASAVAKVRAALPQPPGQRLASAVLRALLLDDILPVLDNLYLSRRALYVGPAFAGEHALRDLVDILLTTFLSTLRQEGLLPLDPMGEPFDPHFHEAVQIVERAGTPPGSIAAVIQPGFRLGTNLLRAARVAVAGNLPTR